MERDAGAKGPPQCNGGSVSHQSDANYEEARQLLLGAQLLDMASSIR